MDAARSVRPGACPHTDSELPKTNSRWPGPRCERRSFDRSCARSLALDGPPPGGRVPVWRKRTPAAYREAAEFASFPESIRGPWGGSPVICAAEPDRLLALREKNGDLMPEKESEAGAGKGHVRCAGRALVPFVRLSSERASQAVRQHCSFAKKQEPPPALLVVVHRARQPDRRRHARSRHQSERAPQTARSRKPLEVTGLSRVRIPPPPPPRYRRSATMRIRLFSASAI
jgi:hypothetical protein